MDTDGDNTSEKLKDTIYTNREIYVASPEKYISGDCCSRMDTDGYNKAEKYYLHLNRNICCTIREIH